MYSPTPQCLAFGDMPEMWTHLQAVDGLAIPSATEYSRVAWRKTQVVISARWAIQHRQRAIADGIQSAHGWSRVPRGYEMPFDHGIFKGSSKAPLNAD